jgi:hypothetical protein
VPEQHSPSLAQLALSPAHATSNGAVANSTSRMHAENQSSATTNVD